jgi:hypothetical protein
LLATVYRCLGINPEQRFVTHASQPTRATIREPHQPADRAAAVRNADPRTSRVSASSLDQGAAALSLNRRHGNVVRFTAFLPSLIHCAAAVRSFCHLFLHITGS